MIEAIREELRQSADKEYKRFQESLIPGLTTMMGVRMPQLRKMAKKIAGGDYAAFLEKADDTCYEELMLQGIVIEMCIRDSLTAPDDFSAVREALEKEGIPMAEADVAMIPQTYVELSDEQDVKNLQRTLDLLEDDDDVQYVWHNWDE